MTKVVFHGKAPMAGSAAGQCYRSTRSMPPRLALAT